MIKDWKTTLFGLAAAIFNLMANGMTLKNALLSATIGALGAFSADAHK